MDNDDRQIGRILRRREVLALLAATGGVAILTRTPLGRLVSSPTGLAEAVAPVASTADTALAQELPACIVRPELTEGPYFVDNQLDRSDIRVEPSDGSVKEGVPFELIFNVSQIGTDCAPLGGARVDVWHCDARGEYSGVTDNSFASSTVGQKFLRGYQLTDDGGVARFITVYPGWYSGRAVHIHFKIRTTTTTGDSYEFTSQFFLDDALSDQVFTRQPYASKGPRNVRNDSDNIYRSGGDQLLLDAVASGDGYAAAFAIGLDLSDAAVGAADSGGMGGPGGPGFPPGRGGPPR
jgi:protocatechuate 3,4-dioxygenase beta subunit